MKNKKVSIKTMIIIVLIGISITLILSNLNNKNNNITKQELSKEQLTQTTSSNAYVSMSDHLKEVSNQSSGNRTYIIKDGDVQEGWDVTFINGATSTFGNKYLEFGSKTGVLVGITGIPLSAVDRYFCVDFYIGGTPNTRITSNSASGGADYILASNVSRVEIPADVTEIGWWVNSSSTTKYLYNMWIEEGNSGGVQPEY